MDELVKRKIILLYEDNHLLVVVKPNNLLSQGDNTKDIDLLTILKKYLKEKYQKPGNVYLGLVHRLDRVVGGVMVFAKTSKAASRLSNDIRNNKMHKNYLAVLHGNINNSGTLQDYLYKKDDFNTIVSNSKNGKLAELFYQKLEYIQEKNYSLVKVSLKTGRHHQIRVQFSSRNYPLVGDKRYGKDTIKTIGLFSYQLSFIHPVTKKEMVFTYYPNFFPFNLFSCLKDVNN